MQRIASYFSAALADRILRNLPGVYKAFNSTKASTIGDELLVQRMFFEFLPFVKVAHVVSNQAIIESMEGERNIHLIDLNATEPAQWCALMRDLRARPEGPPSLKITGIHPRKEVLNQMAHVLTREAEIVDFPLQFNPIVTRIEDLDFEKLRVQTGEALAVSSITQLHTLLACEDNNARNSSSSTPMMHQTTLKDLFDKDRVSNGCNNHPSHDSASSTPSSSSSSSSNLDSFLSGLWGLCPKIVMVTEQDSEHNSKNLTERLSKSLYFYGAIFDSLETALPRNSTERLKLEKMMLGEEIKNIIACEGSERRERHEKLDKWSQRFELAGFVNVPLSYSARLEANKLLQRSYSDGYKIREENGSVVILWQDQSIFSVSAWRCRKEVTK